MDIKAPDLGVDSAEVSEILVAVGDVITEDDNIVLLESDKASVEVPSSAAGTVTAISVAVGDVVSEGSLLIQIETSTSNDAQSEEQTASDANKATNEQAANKAESKPSTNTEEPKVENSSVTDNQGSGTSVSAASSTETYALPDLGVDSAEVAEIMVSVGDKVTAEQSLLLIESDKASVEVPAPVAGTVTKILVQAGDTVSNGQDFITIESVGQQGSEADPNGSTDTASSNANASANETTTNNKNADLETTSANVSAGSQAGVSHSANNSKSTQSAGSAGAKLSEAQINAKSTNVYAGPAVRKLARQLGVDITQVPGSAANGRIVKENVFDFVKSHIQTQSSSNNAATNQSGNRGGLPNLPDMSKTEIWGEIETQNLTRLQKVSIPQLNYNTYLPQVTQFDLSDITETESLRKSLKAEFKADNIGLTILAFIVKATAYALTQHPKFNSHLSDDNTQVYIRKSVNMGIAVATDDGLIVPVIKDAHSKGIKQIAIEIGELAVKARDKKLTTKDLQGASFTISSQGNLGGTYFTPLVNWPQVGILGVSEATMQPRWNDAKQSFEPRLMLPLSLSYDHRVINGADAAVFTRYIAKLLADPRRILL